MSTSNGSGAIVKLDETSTRRIVSGQAVNDLSGAVKELVDNALDASSTSIKIRLYSMGLEIVEVSDDGVGVPLEARPYLATPHATSKIRSFEEIHSSSCSTLGFRGEALAGLANMSSKLVVATQTADEECGQKLEYDQSGTLVPESVCEYPRKVGTTVAIIRLFDAFPVRRMDLMRRIQYERTKLFKLLQEYAVFCLGVGIKVIDMTNDGRECVRMETSAASTSLEQNVSSILGFDFLKSLTRLDLRIGEDVLLEGLISKTLSSKGGDAAPQYASINGRPVDLPNKMSRCIREAWRLYFPKSRPALILQMTLPPNSFDINLTPDKRLVHFTDEDTICTRLYERLVDLWAHHKGGTFATQQVQFPLEVAETQSSEEEDNSERYRHKRRHAFVHDFTKAKLQHEEEEREISQQEQAAAEDTRTSQDATDQYPSGQAVDNQHDEDSESDEEADDGPGDPETTACAAALTPIEIDNSQDEMPPSGTTVVVEESTDEPISRQPNETPKSAGKTETVDLTHGAATTPSVSREPPAKVTPLEHSDSPQQSSDPHSSELDSPSDRDRLRWQAVQEKFNDSQRGDPQRIQEVSSPGVADSADSPEREPARAASQDTQASTMKPSFADFAFRPGVNNKRDKRGRVQDLETSAPNKKPRENNGGYKVASSRTVDDHAEEKKFSEVLQEDFAESQSQEQSQGLEQSQEEETVDSDSQDALQDEDDCPVIWESFGGTEDVVAAEKEERLRMRSRKRSLQDIQSSRAEANESGDGENGAWSLTKEDLASMTVIGQFNLGFILARCRNNHLWILDQHACDERYNYERLCETTKIEEQTLLKPLPLELSPTEETCVLENMEVFEKNGFRFKFDPDKPPRHRLALTALPNSGARDGRKAVQFGKDDVVALCNILGSDGLASASGSGTGVDGSGKYGNNAVRRYAGSVRSSDTAEKVFALLPKAIAMFANRACRGSIMIGTALSNKEMEAVVKRLGDGVKDPWTCPHGRPTMRHVCDLMPLFLENERKTTEHISGPTQTMMSQGGEE